MVSVVVIETWFQEMESIIILDGGEKAVTETGKDLNFGGSGGGSRGWYVSSFERRWFQKLASIVLAQKAVPGYGMYRNTYDRGRGSFGRRYVPNFQRKLMVRGDVFNNFERSFRFRTSGRRGGGSRRWQLLSFRLRMCLDYRRYEVLQFLRKEIRWFWNDHVF